MSVTDKTSHVEIFPLNRDADENIKVMLVKMIHPTTINFD
jgi:hypothetical protein